jgi:hypothetical protein
MNNNVCKDYPDECNYETISLSNDKFVKTLFSYTNISLSGETIKSISKTSSSVGSEGISFEWNKKPVSMPKKFSIDGVKVNFHENVSNAVKMLEYMLIIPATYQDIETRDNQDAEIKQNIENYKNWNALSQPIKENFLFYEKVHKKLVNGFIYYIQHCLELTLFSRPFTIDDYSVAIKMYQILYDYRKKVFSNSGAGDHDITGMYDFHSKLLSFLNGYKNILSEKDYERLHNLLNDPKKFMELFNEIMDDKMTIVSVDDKYYYDSFFNKLDNLKTISKKLIDKGITNENGIMINENDILYCDMSSVEDCLKDKYQLYRFTEGQVIMKDLKSDTLNAVNSLIHSVNQKPKQRLGEPSKSDIKFVQDSMELLDSLYLALVVFYEGISGAVRVYLRTKDYVGGVSLPLTTGNEQECQNDICKMYDTNRIDIMFNETKMNFGPFYKIMRTGATNKDLIEHNDIDINAIKELFNAGTVQNPFNLVLFTYGFSGSGKTFTLFGNKGEKNGIFFYIENELSSEYTLRFAGYKKIYGYLDKNKFTVNNVIKKFNEDDDANINTFLDENIYSEVRTDKMNINDFIKSTPNNPQSSRGFLILTFEVIPNGSELPIGKIGLVDMAGNEEPYDLLIKLLPTVTWPYKIAKRDKIKPSFLTEKALDFGNIDFVYHEYRKSCFEFITQVSGLVSFFLGKRKLSTKTGSVETFINIVDQIIYRLQEVYKYSSEKYKLDCISNQNCDISFDQLLAKVLNRKNKRMYYDTIKKCIVLLNENILTRTGLGTTAEVLNRVGEKYGMTKDKDGRTKIIRMEHILKDNDVLKTKNYEAYKVEFFQNPNTNKVNIVVDAMDIYQNSTQSMICAFNVLKNIRKQMKEISLINNKANFTSSPILKQLYESVYAKTYKIIVDLMSETFLMFKVTDRENECFSISDIDSYSDKMMMIVEYCENILYTCLNIETEYRPLFLHLVQFASLTKYLFQVNISNLLKCSNNDQMGTKFTIEFDPNKVPMGQTYSRYQLGNFINSLFFDNLKMSYMMCEKTKKTYRIPGKYKIQELAEVVDMGAKIKDNKNDICEVGEFAEHILDIKEDLMLQFNSHFSKLQKSILIENKEVTFSQDILLRIVNEGFFINQANAELIQFLTNRKNNIFLKTTNDINECQLNQEDLFYEKYNKFKSNYKNGLCSVTNIVDSLNSDFDPKTTKYMMICNIRRESETKFRLGAIDTLTLVRDLKST